MIRHMNIGEQVDVDFTRALRWAFVHRVDAALGDPRARHDDLGRNPHRTAGQGYEQLGELAERVDLSTSPFAGDWSVSPVAKVPRRPGRGCPLRPRSSRPRNGPRSASLC